MSNNSRVWNQTSSRIQLYTVTGYICIQKELLEIIVSFRFSIFTDREESHVFDRDTMSETTCSYHFKEIINSSGNYVLRTTLWCCFKSNRSERIKGQHKIKTDKYQQCLRTINRFNTMIMYMECNKNWCKNNTCISQLHRKKERKRNVMFVTK